MCVLLSSSPFLRASQAVLELFPICCTPPLEGLIRYENSPHALLRSIIENINADASAKAALTGIRRQFSPSNPFIALCCFIDARLPIGYTGESKAYSFLCRSKLMETRLVRFISTKTCLLIYLNRAIRALGWRVSKDESFRQNGKLWRSGSVYQQRRLSRHIIHGKFIHLCTVKLFYFVLCSTVSV